MVTYSGMNSLHYHIILQMNQHQQKRCYNIVFIAYRLLKNAISEDEVGAMYPWQSGMYGDEQSQLIHLNTVDNTWIPDNSRLQRHVSLAIAYDMWVYQQMTGKTDVLADNGLKMLIQIARFWINKAQKDGDRYSIKGVMGPNEFHEEVPGSVTGGLPNNA